MTKTHAQLLREIAVLQAAADKQRAVESKGAVEKINEMIAQYGLAAADLKFGSNGAEGPSTKSAAVAKSMGSKAKPASAAVAANAARYSDGQGNQWGGRGPRPAWLRAALAAGRSLESFLTGATPAPEAPVSAATTQPQRAAAEEPTVAASAASAGKATATQKVAVAKKPATRKTAAKKSADESESAAALPVAPVKAEKKSPAKKAVVAKKAVAKKATAKSPTRKNAARKQKTDTKPAQPTVKTVARKAAKAVAKKAASKSSRKTAAKVPAAKKSLPARKRAAGDTATPVVTVSETSAVA